MLHQLFRTLWRVWLVLLFLLAIQPAAWAFDFAKWANQEKPVVSSNYQNGQISVHLMIDAPQGVAAGSPMHLGLLLEPKPLWHTYWRNPGDSGMEPQLNWALPKGLSVGEITWPTPEVINLGGIKDFGYARPILLTVPLFMDDGSLAGKSNAEIKLKASWLVCKTECLPQSASFVLTIKPGEIKKSDQSWFESARRKAPKQGEKLASSISFDGKNWQLQVRGLPLGWQGKSLAIFPESPRVVDTHHLGTQAWQGDVWGAELRPDVNYSPTKNTEVYINLALDTESVRLPLTFGTAKEAPLVGAGMILKQPTALRGQGSGVNPLFHFGWMLLAAALGGIILNLMPCVFPVLAIKVVGLVGHPEYRRGQGFFYAIGVVLFMVFLGGLLMLLRAGGNELGWGFQLQSPIVLSILAVLFTLIGLNLAGVFEMGNWSMGGLAGKQLVHPYANAFLSGLLTVAIASPCTAPFMGASLGYALGLPMLSALGIFVALGVGLAFPYWLFCQWPGLTKYMPKPGVWMVHLRIFLAFPMWLTVVWILWVLSHLNGALAAFSLLAFCLTVAWLIWAWHLESWARWFYGLLATLLLIFIAYTQGVGWIKIVSKKNQTVAQVINTSQVWHAWSPQLVKDAISQGRPVLVDFTAAWCITCQYNKTVLDSAPVQALLAKKNVLLLLADWTAQDPQMTEALQSLKRSGVPTTVLYWPQEVPFVFDDLLTQKSVLTKLSEAQLPSPV